MAIAAGDAGAGSAGAGTDVAGRRQRRVRQVQGRCKEGKNADYIPALAKVDPNLFGIALVTVDGKVYTAGDMKTEVSIQSISKVFTMAQVIQEPGRDVDREDGSASTRPARGSTRSSPSKASRQYGTGRRR